MRGLLIGTVAIVNELHQHVIKTKDADAAAKRVCRWLNSQRNVEFVTISQAFFDDHLHTTIFFLTVGDMANTDTPLVINRPRPKTGEKRMTRLPLRIDRLPKVVQDAIIHLRKLGKIWVEIEQLSSRPFAQNWSNDEGGFVDWNALPDETRRLYPRRRIPKSSLQRWYDIRVEQSGRL